jgi:hypothetical protein
MVNPFFFREPAPPEPYAVPEREDAYPEPSMFGILPAYAFYVRHASGIELSGVTVGFDEEDSRPAFVLQDVAHAEFHDVEAERAAGTPTFVLEDVTDFSTHDCRPVKDLRLERVERRRSY